MLGFQAPRVEIGRGQNMGEQGRLEHSVVSQMGCTFTKMAVGGSLYLLIELRVGSLAILAQLPWVMSSRYHHVTGFSSLLAAPGNSSP